MPEKYLAKYQTYGGHSKRKKKNNPIIAFFILILVTVIILAILQLRGQFRANACERKKCQN